MVTIDANALAQKAGSLQSANIVMLGALFGSGKMPVAIDKIKESVKSRFPAKASAANLEAFDLGYKMVAPSK